DFEAIDGRRVDIVCLLLLPTDSQGEHLNALACAARILREPEAIRNIRSAADGAALYRAVGPGLQHARDGARPCGGYGSRSLAWDVVRIRDRVADAGYACNARSDLHTIRAQTTRHRARRSSNCA